MQLPTVNRDISEKVFISVKNVEGATITAALPVAYALVTSNDGISATIANAAADYPGFLGVAVRDIPNNDYGQVQIAGYVASILLSNVGTSITINAGDPLVPSPAGFFSGAPAYANSGFRWIAASNVPVAVSAAAYASGIIRMV
jgi:predicted regulator of Ras-like GTPase activity (Roadblock/LC7/MglB family)